MDLNAEPEVAPTLALLESAGLPTADVNATLVKNFIGASDETGLVGVIGYERFGRTGLLRSLVVAGSARTSGLGAQLVEALEAKARQQGVTSLFLLTTDADAYFSRHGYVAIDRADAPEDIRQTAQFSSLCPGSAVVMRKNIQR